MISKCTMSTSTLTSLFCNLNIDKTVNSLLVSPGISHNISPLLGMFSSPNHDKRVYYHLVMDSVCSAYNRHIKLLVLRCKLIISLCSLYKCKALLLIF